MKKFFSFVLIFAVISLACNTIMPRLNNDEIPTIISETPREVTASILPKLQELGGMPCEEKEELTCVTIQVPLNHFDSANIETIDVVFGVLPASGDRYGMF